MSDLSSLGHVVLVGGTPHQWLDMSSDEWRERIAAIVKGTSVARPHWVTLMPHSGEELSVDEREEWLHLFEHDVKAKTVVNNGWNRSVFDTDDGVSVIIDPCANGRTRFVSLLEHVRREHVRTQYFNVDDLDENTLAEMVFAPANVEPDLVVILGPPDRVPTSMVWELGYSELVFLDLAWNELEVAHLEVAVDDFHRRQRRFGGLDS